jgi:hypothetical protein
LEEHGYDTSAMGLPGSQDTTKIDNTEIEKTGSFEAKV